VAYKYAGTKPTYATVGNGARYELKPCGTEAAYRRHKRNQEQPCLPCYDAHAQRARTQRKAKTNAQR
jgi:hypothetical protein